MLDFNYTILIQFLNLLVLLILLRFLLFKPIMNALKKRQEAIGSLAAKAEAKGEESQRLGKAYEEGMKEKKKPVIDQREATVKEAHASAMKSIEEARRDLAVELEKVRETVRKEADDVLTSLRTETARLSEDITKKILRRG